MQQGESTNSGPVQERPYRYHRWRNTVIRERGILDVEYLSPAGWGRSSYAVDALTGMGEDPYSCGESCDEVTETEAVAIAEARGLSLSAGRAERDVAAPREAWPKGRRGFVARILRRR